MLREILIWPDRRLKEKSMPVQVFDPALKALIDDMFETMYHAEGVGLAAPQIAVLQRVIVVDTSARQEGQRPMVLINPEIVRAEGEASYTEGCLSIPGEAEDTGVRAERVTVKALDRDGQPFEHNAEGLLAIAVQHEMDHLEGVLFVDHLSSLKREMIRKRMKRLKEDLAAEKQRPAAPSEGAAPAI